MKRTSLILLLLLPLWAAAQNRYTISGKLPAGKGQLKAYLYLLKDNKYQLQDSSQIKNGVFSFTGVLAEPLKAMLFVRYQGDEKIEPTRLKDALEEFYVEQGTIRIESADSIRNARVNGSVVNRENQQLQKAVKPYLPAYKRIGRELYMARRKPGAEKEAWFIAKADSLKPFDKQINKIYNEFIKIHPSSFIALSLFNNHIIRPGGFGIDTVQAAFSKFSASLRSSPLGLQIAGRIAKEDRRQPGTLAYDFTQPDINGKPFTLSSLKGKYVLVDFWASWCKPCRAENPYIKKAYKLLKDKGLEVVSISMDQNRFPWEYAMKEDGMPWINVSDLKGVKNEVAVYYGITSIPKNMLIDPKGVIIAKDLRGEDLPEKLAALMK